MRNSDNQISLPSPPRVTAPMHELVIDERPAPVWPSAVGCTPSPQALLMESTLFQAHPPLSFSVFIFYCVCSPPSFSFPTKKNIYFQHRKSVWHHRYCWQAAFYRVSGTIEEGLIINLSPRRFSSREECFFRAVHVQFHSRLCVCNSNSLSFILSPKHTKLFLMYNYRGRSSSEISANSCQAAHNHRKVSPPDRAGIETSNNIKDELAMGVEKSPFLLALPKPGQFQTLKYKTKVTLHPGSSKSAPNESETSMWWHVIADL